MAAVTTVLLSVQDAEALIARALEDLTVAGQRLGDLRTALLELYEGEGWRALGYESWRACVVDRFGKKQAWFYQQVQAARLERMLALPSGALPVTVARALNPVASDPSIVKRVYQAAGPNPTERQVQRAVETVRAVPKPTGGPARAQTPGSPWRPLIRALESSEADLGNTARQAQTMTAPERDAYVGYLSDVVDKLQARIAVMQRLSGPGDDDAQEAYA